MAEPLHISITQFRDQLASYIEIARNGGEVVLTSHGKSVAKLCPSDEPAPRKPGILKGKIGPIPDDVWDMPDDLIEIMEGRAE
jgi:prevent-host-death family protein